MHFIRGDIKLKLLHYILLISLFCSVLGGSGCVSTPQEKLDYYNCNYVVAKNGWCCEKEVPEYDRYILDCENVI